MRCVGRAVCWPCRRTCPAGVPITLLWVMTLVEVVPIVNRAAPATLERTGDVMTNTALDKLGPVDFVIVEFPAETANFTGEMVDQLLKLVDAGTIRVIDILILVKNDDGEIEAMELADLEDLGELQVLEAEMAELLAEDDVIHLAAAMDPGSTAGVIIYENLWAAPFASAIRHSGGVVIADGRIPIQQIIASIEADQAIDDEYETVGD